MNDLKFKPYIERNYKNKIYSVIKTHGKYKVIIYSKIPMYTLRRIVYNNIFKNLQNSDYHSFLRLKKYDLINHYYKLINC